jgi:lysophospholipase L1-like esterase
MKLLAFLLLGVSLGAHGEDFAFRDGDTVAFLGDSITAARGYSKIVEHYTLMRFPQRDVHFVNAGKGGDTTLGAVERLERDVFAPKATVVTVALGVNDIGWGMKADAEHKQRYLDGLRQIIEACGRRHVRVIVCSPAITSDKPDNAEKSFLQAMADEGLALAQSLGAQTIDLQRGMREIQRHVLEGNAHEKDPAKQTSLHLPDGIHLNDFGHLVLAFVMLKGLGAPADVSALTLDAASGAIVEASGCRASDVHAEADGITFVREDDGLPLNLGTFSAFNYRFIPIPAQLNRYLLAVKNLAPGKYEIRAEGRAVGTATAQQLAHGLNISSMTADGWQPGGPWDAQSVAVKELVEARDHLWFAGRLRALQLPTHPDAAALMKSRDEAEEQLHRLQRATAKPYPYHFEIRRAEPGAEKKKATN